MISVVVKAIFGALRAIPWWAWVVFALIGAAYWYGERRYDAGQAAERAMWEDAQALAEKEAKADEEARDRASKAVSDESANAAQDAVVETRDETASAVERVRYVTRKIVVPADCPGLPDSVSDEGRAAVERARAAQGPVRAAGNP